MHWLLFLALSDLGHIGNRWAWTETSEVFVPQLVMYATPPHFYGNPAKVDRDIQTFLVEHGFNGFHVFLSCRWFDLGADDCREVAGSDPPLDSRTFDALEMLIRKTYEAGGMVHLWMWGDEERGQTPSSRPDWGGLGGPVARKLEAEIARRLGPLPGWSMGYGFDLNEWVTASELRAWRDRMQGLLPRFHFLGGRPGGPNRGENHARFAAWNEGLDYASYEHHEPTYAVYVAALEQNPDKPILSEDRFRVFLDGDSKHYTVEDVRRGLWHSTLAGGVGNIWGYLLEGGDHDVGSAPFPNREEIRTHFEFVRGRFSKEMRRCSREGADPRSDVLCLGSGESGRFLFYIEDAEEVELDLRSMKSRGRAVAVDARRSYAELALGDLSPGLHPWKAPYRSDWAVAVGSFDRAGASPFTVSRPPTPTAPTDLFLLSGSARHVELGFRDRSDDERGFEVERFVARAGVPADFEKVATLPRDVARFSDPSLRPGILHRYRIRGFNDAGPSGYTGAVSVLALADGTLVASLEPESVRLGFLEAGDPYYVDRDYRVQSFPGNLGRAIWIRTANDDKFIEAERFITLQITRPAAIYVGFDRRAASLPRWLSDWERVGQRIEVDRDAMRYFDLFRRDFPAGTVSLGGNSATPADWGDDGRSHYIVAILPK